MIFKKFGIFLALVAGSLAVVNGDCPCSVDAGSLTCQPGIISEFPEDVFKLVSEECPIDVSQVWNIQLAQQPITRLKNDAFRDFVASGLYAIAFEFGSLAVIERDAFRGLENSLKEIYLKNNLLTEIEQGALDNLVRLRVFDVRENVDKEFDGEKSTRTLASYTATSWNFCHRVANQKLTVQGALTFYKDFALQTQELNDLYCKSWPHELTCRIEGFEADCSGLLPLDVESNICSLKEQVAAGVSNVIIDFPVDQATGQVEEFFQGESASFFQAFNAYGASQDMSYTKLKRSLTLYGTKFDIATLPMLTSDKTQDVTIKADTIYTSQPLNIHYKLKLVGRVVAITQPITMNMTASYLFSSSPTETWTYSEKQIYLDDQITMRERRFGLVEILDENIDQFFDANSCHPANLTATPQMVSPWMDLTALNLNYICGRTLLTSASNLVLAHHVSDFALRLLHNSTLVGSQRIFNAAQKFKRLNQQSQVSASVHNVPSYSLNTIMKLSEVLYNSMVLYRTNELEQENQLFSSMGRMQDMSQNFQIVEQQQELYFDMEMKQLEAIWADSSTQWNFDFEHRNEIQSNMNDAFNAQAEQIFAMQEQEYAEMLKEAEASVQHMEEVVAKYQVQVDRMIEKAQGSMTVQTGLVAELRKNTDNVQTEIANFKRAAEAWMARQIVKGFLGIIFAFAGAMMGNPASMAEGIAAAMEAGIQIAELIEEMASVIESVENIQDILNGIDLSDIGSVTESMSMEFSMALKNAVDLKLKGPKFDSFESLAIITIDSVNAETDYGIDGATDLMTALKSVSDVGKRVIDEVAAFAEDVLQLAERQDELAVAISDKNRAVEEVTRINAMIEALKEAKRKFEEDRAAAQAEYEAKINEMKEQYEQMTEELRAKFREEITLRFNQFKETFKAGREQYLLALNNLIDSIHIKSLSLKEHSMNQRAMILSLYADFCDTQFYHSFATCTATQTPLMGDDFDELLKKLNDIQWDTLTSTDNLPGKPISFGKPNPYNIIVSDSNVTNIKTPIAILKNNSRVDINLKDYDLYGNFDKFWRVRLDMMRIVLLDEFEKPIPSPGSGFGGYIRVGITYPTTFNDTNFRNDKYSFLAQDFFCMAEYSTSGEEVQFVSQCMVDDEFTDTNYKPAPDGLFSFKLVNPEQIDVDRIQKIKIEFAGNSIPRDVNNMKWIQ